MSTSATIERDALVVVCATSAGIHAALTPSHFDEGAGPGLGFAAAAVLLAGLVVLLTRRPASRVAVAGTGAVFAGLIASYALATTIGVPLLHPHPEPADGLGLTTKAFEAIGLFAALHILWHGRPAAAIQHLRPKGTWT